MLVMQMTILNIKQNGLHGSDTEQAIGEDGRQNMDFEAGTLLGQVIAFVIEKSQQQHQGDHRKYKNT